MQEVEDAQHSAQTAEQRAAAAEKAAEALRTQLQAWTEQAAALASISAHGQHAAHSCNGSIENTGWSTAGSEAVVIEMGEQQIITQTCEHVQTCSGVLEQIAIHGKEPWRHDGGPVACTVQS